MAVYREGYDCVKVITEASDQVFNDACDFGAPCSKDDPIWKAAKQLAEWYGIEGTRVNNDNHSYSVKVELLDEWALSDRRKTEKEATDIYKMEYTSLEPYKNKSYLRSEFKGKQGFITVSKIN